MHIIKQFLFSRIINTLNYPPAFYKKMGFIFCACIISLSLAAFSYAAKFPVSINQDGKTLETEDELPWKIFADQLVSLNDGLILEGRGNVLLSRGTDYLKADFARLYTNTQWILLQGNVFAKLGQDEVKATEAEFDLSNNTGWVKNASIFMAGPHMYFSSEELYKNKGDRYLLKNAIVTACDGTKPLWSIEASEADVEPDGYASFTNPIFNIKDQNLIYSPYLIVPTKTTRQTGLLQPEYGVSSQHGVYFTQPWFYAIDQSRDLTFYGTILTKKGFLPSIEYRSHTKENQKLWGAVDFLYENDVVRHDSEDDVDSSDGYIRDNRSRYWLRSMGNGDILETSWNYKFNLDYVSDQNFLREYQNRMTGFDNSRTASYEMFGRDFAELDQNRVSEGYLFRDWNRLTVTAGMRFEQDPSLENGNKDRDLDETVQRLPEFYAFWNKGRIFEKLPLEIQTSAHTAYMFRQEGTSGFRSEIYPQISLPVDLRFATMELNTGVRATLYHNTSENRNSPVTATKNRKIQDSTDRIIPEFGVNFYTQATRTWEWPKELDLTEANVGESTYTGMRHFMQPRLRYSWVEDVNQEDNPYYIREDRIQDTNSLLFSLDNHFTFRKDSVSKTKQGLELNTSYQDLIKLKFSGGYDFREADRERLTDVFENRPWHDLRLRAELSPYSWISFNTDFFYSLYDTEISRIDTGISLIHPRYGSFSSSYSMRESAYNYRELVNYDNPADIIPTEPLDVITNSILWNVTPKFQIYGLERTNLETGKSFERMIGVGFLHQCVRVFGEYTKDAQEEAVHLNVEFMGLGF